MPKMSLSPLLAVPALFVWCLGCGGTFPNQVSLQTNPTTVPLAERQYEFVERGLQGKVCQIKVLGLGIGDISYLRALDELRSQVPEELKDNYQFVNVAVDESFEFFVFAHRSCTIVSADLVALGAYAFEGRVPGASSPQYEGAVPLDPYGESDGGQELEPAQEGEAMGEAVPNEAEPVQENESEFSDITQSRKAYKAQCNKGKGAACEKLALMWQHGLKGRRRVTKAVTLHKKACQLGVAASCGYMGKVLAARDPDGAARYYGKACELGATEHCKTE